MTIDDHLEITTPEGVVLHLDVVGVGSRCLARILDTLIQVASLFALFLVIGAAGGGNGVVAAILIIAFFVVLVLYDPLFELLMKGQTPGKRATGIRVVDREGRPVAFLASAIRNTVRLVDFLPFFYGAGLVAMVSTRHAQRLGDLAAGTLVVRDRATDVVERGRRSFAGKATVPVSAVTHWDVTRVTSGDIETIRHFLDRRVTLPPRARSELAIQIATAIAPRVGGVPVDAHPEYLLEGIVVAKERR